MYGVLNQACLLKDATTLYYLLLLLDIHFSFRANAIFHGLFSDLNYPWSEWISPFAEYPCFWRANTAFFCNTWAILFLFWIPEPLPPSLDLFPLLRIFARILGHWNDISLVFSTFSAASSGIIDLYTISSSSSYANLSFIVLLQVLHTWILCLARFLRTCSLLQQRQRSL